ncbi:molybdopterin-dependent oxidoreductase [Candidatus Sumerlaeota bacterium]|nr:molybdopterin-dependent oxidoreductase [Candidatus Sumerlaeota bacterium]
MNEHTRRQFLLQTGAALALGLGVDATWLGAQSATPPAIADRWRWRLRVGGAVAQERLLSLEDLLNLPSRIATLRLCDPESGRSSLAQWQGLHLSTLVRLTMPHPEARSVHVLCADGHRDGYTVADLMRPRALLAHTREGLLLDAAEGGPLRLVLPWRRADRSAVAIESIEFHSSPPPGLEPLRGALPAGEERAKRGQSRGAATPWDEAMPVEIPPEQRVRETAHQWDLVRNPQETPRADAVDWFYIPALSDPDFRLANEARSCLTHLGAYTLSSLNPEEGGPLTSPIPQVRLYAQTVLSEVDEGDATQWAAAGLEDPDPLVAAVALDTLVRRRHAGTLGASLERLQSPDDGLALTAIAGVGALAAPGEEVALAALAEARSATAELTRLSEIDRVREHLTSP